MIFQSERYSDCVDELVTFQPAQYAELNVPGDKFPMKFDYTTYFKLEEAGVLRLCTARVAETQEMVGFILWMLAPYLHCMSCVQAFDDSFYIAPEYRSRGVGKGLFQCFEREAEAAGANRLILSCKVHGDTDRSEIFEHLGYSLYEKKFTKVI